MAAAPETPVNTTARVICRRFIVAPETEIIPCGRNAVKSQIQNVSRAWEPRQVGCSQAEKRLKRKDRCAGHGKGAVLRFPLRWKNLSCYCLLGASSSRSRSPRRILLFPFNFRLSIEDPAQFGTVTSPPSRESRHFSPKNA